MKLHTNKTLYSSMFLAVLMSSSSFASHIATESTAISTPGKFYIGIFGGGGSSNEINVNQFGTAFYTEAAGGPLAVNAFGHTHSHSSGLFGAQVGYQAQDLSLALPSQWALAPAFELEGYSLNQESFTGDLLNDTARLPEHDFVVTYPMRRSVFLTNVVLTLDNPCILFHPYVGVGIGGAIVKISHADATQIDPPEVGVNHYNANTTDTSTTFAGQIKAGLSYDITQYISVFAEYRWLYLSSTEFAFGSTVYAGHPETSNWQVKLDHQNYNMGLVGVRVNF